MKQCPVCKSTYSDDSLAFCLSDGTSLISISDVPPPTQKMSFEKMRVDFPSGDSYKSKPTIISSPISRPKEGEDGKSLRYALLTVGLLLLLGVGAVSGLLIYNKNDNSGKQEIVLNNSASPSNNANASSKNEENTQELKDRLAKLEKQIENQKNTKTNSSPKPSSTSWQTNSQQGIVTVAQVRSSNDGFLSLRNAPNAQTGTQILKIPTGSTVEIQNCQKNYLTIDSRRGRWCMVSYDGETGWVFDAWLSY